MGSLGPPFDPEFLNALEERVAPWAGEAWRIVFRGSDPLASNSRGARWNPPDFEALYFSLDPRGAHAELDYLQAQQPIPIRRERLVYRFELQLARVLDLRSVSGLMTFGITPEALVEDNWQLTQGLAFAAYRFLECAGVLAPSARYAATNLAVFLGGLGARDELSDPTLAPNGPVEHI